MACARFLQGRVIGRSPETQVSRGAGGSGLQGIGAHPGPAPELPRAVECPKPSSERKHDNDDDVSALPERRRRIWRSLAKPNYTFGTGTLFVSVRPKIGGSQEIFKILIVLVFVRDSDTSRSDFRVIEDEAGHLLAEHGRWRAAQ